MTRKKRREYNQIKAGTKMKWAYIEASDYGWNVMGFIEENYPEEFGIKIDMEKQFEAVLLSYVKRVFTVLGWAVPNLKIRSIKDFF